MLYHRGNAGCDQARAQESRDAGSEEQMLKEIRELYKGRVTIAKYAKPPYNEIVVNVPPAMLGPVAQVARARP